MTKAPIAILSFNRPHYLEQVLRSLAAQPGINERKVILFQDGAINIFSRKLRCDATVPDRNWDLVRAILPHTEPILSQINLGTALNFERAERYMFGKIGLDADAVIFLEDDLVLGPHYLTMLDQMLDFALADERIGYVTAYGIKSAGQFNALN